MFDEYKKLLSWDELKKLNSWEELKGLSNSRQLYFSVISMLRALGYCQVWVAMAFLALCGYFGTKLGNSLGLKIGLLNLGTLCGAVVGGAVYSIVHVYEAKKYLRKLLQKKA
jgi:hypothetical protein